MRCLVVAAVALIAAASGAAAEVCEGPFAQCAVGVKAICSRDADGVQRIVYWDLAGKTVLFEQCVGRVYESRGLPNPYKTGVASGELPFPRSEILDSARDF